MKIIASGVLGDLDCMVTHRFSGLAASREAFEIASRTIDDNGNLILKVLIEI